MEESETEDQPYPSYACYETAQCKSILHEEEWEVAAGQFQRAWEFISPPLKDKQVHLQWDLRERNTSATAREVYLALDRVSFESATSSESVQQDDCQPEVWECVSNASDDNCLTAHEALGQRKFNMHYFDFHILYNSSYQVPELFLQAYTDRGEPLGLEVILQDLHIHSSQNLSDLRAMFLEKEHPYFSLPWIGTHLCETNDVMKLVAKYGEAIEGMAGTLQYMISWWSIMSKYIALHVPLDQWAKVCKT